MLEKIIAGVIITGIGATHRIIKANPVTSIIIIGGYVGYKCVELYIKYKAISHTHNSEKK